MNDKQLYWSLYQAKLRQAKALEEKKKEQMNFFTTFLKKSVDIKRKMK